ncbi:MAG TPA: hypothetical protein VNK70_01455 [Candidatus Paceibacterota bacterium]|nr:hypothetical protein [Candidatus Paceibacterota bacterium]
MNLKTVRRVAADLAVISLVAMPLLGFAQGGAFPENPISPDVNTGQGLIGLLQKIATWIAIIFFAVAVIFIIIAAFGYLTSGGEAEKVSGAKNKIVYAIVAIIVAALAFAVPRLIFNILGFNEPSLP